MTYSMIITTCSDKNEAERLALQLVERKLAACVQISGIKSYYTWENKTCVEPELRLIIKTGTDRYAEVEKFILVNHSYDVPQIIQIPFEKGYSPYLDWISDNT